MSNNKYYAIIVSFNPDIEKLQKTVTSLSAQGFCVVVVDNNSKNKDEIRKTISCGKTIFLDENCGIAKALNIGMEYSASMGAEWVLSSDQDTTIPDNILSEYCKYLELDRIGALCPCIRRKDGYEQRNNSGREYEVVERCPTSGFFLSTKAWEECGRYDDWMFIDYVDYDICIKLKINGFKVYRISTVCIVQNLGRSSVVVPLEKVGRLMKSRKLVNFSHIYNHSPMRNFYFVRNSLYYQDKYRGAIDLKKERRFLIKWEAKKLLLERHRLKTAKSIIKGYLDYKKHKSCINERNK